MALLLRNINTVKRQFFFVSRTRINLCKHRSRSFLIEKSKNQQIFRVNQILDGVKQFSNDTHSFNAIIDAVSFERNCSETLEAL
jgi:hypothetical protein